MRIFVLLILFVSICHPLASQAKQIQKAKDLIADRKYEKAEVLLLKTLAKYPEHLPALEELSNIYTKTGPYEKALANQEIIDRLDKHSRSGVSLAMMELMMSKKDKAIQRLRTYVANNPGKLHPLGMLANLIILQNDPNKSFDYIKEISNLIDTSVKNSPQPISEEHGTLRSSVILCAYDLYKYVVDNIDNTTDYPTDAVRLLNEYYTRLTTTNYLVDGPMPYSDDLKGDV